MGAGLASDEIILVGVWDNLFLRLNKAPSDLLGMEEYVQLMESQMPWYLVLAYFLVFYSWEVDPYYHYLISLPKESHTHQVIA